MNQCKQNKPVLHRRQVSTNLITCGRIKTKWFGEKTMFLAPFFKEKSHKASHRMQKTEIKKKMLINCLDNFCEVHKFNIKIMVYSEIHFMVRA